MIYLCHRCRTSESSCDGYIGWSSLDGFELLRSRFLRSLFARVVVGNASRQLFALFAPRPVVSKMREMVDRTIFKILVKSHRLGGGAQRAGGQSSRGVSVLGPKRGWDSSQYQLLVEDLPTVEWATLGFGSCGTNRYFFVNIWDYLLAFKMILFHLTIFIVLLTISIIWQRWRALLGLILWLEGPKVLESVAPELTEPRTALVANAAASRNS